MTTARPDPAAHPSAEDLLDLVARVLDQDNIERYARARDQGEDDAGLHWAAYDLAWRVSSLLGGRGMVDYAKVAERLAELAGERPPQRSDGPASAGLNQTRNHDLGPA